MNTSRSLIDRVMAQRAAAAKQHSPRPNLYLPPPVCRRPDKVAHATRAEAQAVQRATYRQHQDHMNVYQCPVGHWHLGHSEWSQA